MSESIVYQSVGVIHSEHTNSEETPIQPVYSEGCQGRVEVFPKLPCGLTGPNNWACGIHKMDTNGRSCTADDPCTVPEPRYSA